MPAPCCGSRKLARLLLAALAVCLAVSTAAAQSLEELRTQALTGDTGAQTRLGNIYRLGRDVPQDYRQALYWYGKAADSNDPVAQNNLGFMYEKGMGAPQDYAQALALYRKSANQGYYLGQIHLANMYWYGIGIAADRGKGLYWAQKAAEQSPAGQSFLATLQKSPADKVPQKNTRGRQLALDEVQDLLNGSVTPKRVATLVQQYGVNFELTPSVTKDLRALGADDKLLLAIAENRR